MTEQIKNAGIVIFQVIAFLVGCAVLVFVISKFYDWLFDVLQRCS